MGSRCCAATPAAFGICVMLERSKTSGPRGLGPSGLPRTPWTPAEAGLSLDAGPGAARAAVAQLDANVLADRGVIIAGNPESCIKTIKMYEDIGVDQVMMIMQTETISHDKVMESLELFGKEVIPAFRNAEAPVAGG